MQIINVALLAVTALATNVVGQLSGNCTSGAYACVKAGNGHNSTVNVCNRGTWYQVASCTSNENCVVDAAGGLTCQ